MRFALLLQRLFTGASSLVAAQGRPRPPELILTNARIYTRRRRAAVGRSGRDLRAAHRRRGISRARSPALRRAADADARPEGRLRFAGVQRRARPHRQHGRVARRRQPARGPRAEGVHRSRRRARRRGCRTAAGSPAATGAPTSNGTPAARAPLRRAAGADSARALYAVPRSDRCGHAGSSGVRAAVRSQHVPRELARAEARRHHRGTPNPPNGEIAEGRQRTADRASSRDRPPISSARSFRRSRSSSGSCRSAPS